MSVLIEAVCLVVPRIVLDVAYPGASDGYLEWAAAQEGIRFAVADEKLVSVSAFEGDALLPLIDPLLERGVVWADDGRAIELVIVDQETGPTLPCDWLVLERHRHGFTRAWHLSASSGALIAPEGWRLEHSWRLERSDVRTGSDDWLRLAEENGLETWLDYSTGLQHVATKDEPASITVQPDAPKAAAGSLAELGPAIATIRELLEDRGVPYRLDLEHRCVVVPFATEEVDRVQVLVSRDADGRRVRFDAVLPDRVAVEHAPLIDAVADRIGKTGSCVLVRDGAAASLCLTTWATPVQGAGRVRAMERALCSAADDAGDVYEALKSLLAGDGSPEICAGILTLIVGQGGSA